MAIHKTGGSRFWISPTEVDVDAIDAMNEGALLSFYEGIDDWVEIEEKENLGTVGDTAESIAFTTIGRNRVRKLKGPRDAGTQELVVGRDPLDDGQEAMIAAEGTDFNYAFKIELNDAKTSAHSKSVLYYAGLVMSRPTNMGPNAQVTTRTFSIGINTSILEVASGPVSVPANTVPPSIVFLGDDTYSANVGSWTNSPTSFAYLWEEDDSGWAAIPNSNVQDLEYAGSNPLRVTVTATNGAGAGTPAVSLPVATA